MSQRWHYVPVVDPTPVPTPTLTSLRRFQALASSIPLVRVDASTAAMVSSFLPDLIHLSGPFLLILLNPAIVFSNLVPIGC